MTAEEVAERLDVEPDRGLDGAEVERRRKEHGANRLRGAERRSVLKILAGQFASVVVLILAAAAVIALAMAHWTEAIAILAVVVVNTAIGFVSEWRAIRTMEGLQELEQPHARVRRGGEERMVAADELVPGDVVLLGPEDVVPADLRIVEAGTLRVEEAPLTGESVPVAKRVDAVDDEAVLAERSSMLFKGTSVAEGEAMAVVTASGMDTELGTISSLAEGASSGVTPLQANLDRLGRRLAWVTVAVAAAVAGAGLLAGQPTELMLETAIALGVAAIPEGLPIVATIALARGMVLMARRQAVINRLTAVETLGATRVIFTDKTGTLTENRMRLIRVATSRGDAELSDDDDGADDDLVRRALEIGVLCSNADLDGEGHGDPTEVALLEAGRQAGLERPELVEEKPEVREQSFDPEVMMMATFHRSGDGLEVAVKGAPAAVIEVCTEVATAADEAEPLDDDGREQWLERNGALADDGLRVLAVADRRVGDEGAEPYRELRLVGLVGLIDPAREGVPEAVQQCQS
ncbi:MAG TPA: HAD-IC family P-type ATPase, partial [Candidatus Sulfomarinibacteraceae bacterium]|nr:HAD-IC family P-type ATPase [Candidatus Sulfomarinibacteraceae bacterium]